MKPVVVGVARRYTIPEGAERKACSSCKAPIYWVLTEKRSACPVDPDGASHFTTCPNANQHSKRTRAKQADLFGGGGK